MRFSKLVFSCCAVVFVLHFVLILLHNTPEKYMTSRMESYSHLYSYPLFHQGWALFAPDPQRKSKRMEIRYAWEGEWHDWIRPEADFEQGHQCYRMLSSSKMFHVTQSAVYFLWLEKDMFDQQELKAEEYYTNSQGYNLACHFANQYAYHFTQWRVPDSLQVRIILDDPFEVEQSEILYFPTYRSLSP